MTFGIQRKNTNIFSFCVVSKFCCLQMIVTTKSEAYHVKTQDIVFGWNFTQSEACNKNNLIRNSWRIETVIQLKIDIFIFNFFSSMTVCDFDTFLWAVVFDVALVTEAASYFLRIAPEKLRTTKRQIIWGKYLSLQNAHSLAKTFTRFIRTFGVVSGVRRTFLCSSFYNSRRNWNREQKQNNECWSHFVEIAWTTDE